MIASVFTFSYDKNIRPISTITHFTHTNYSYLCFQTFFCILTITSSGYSVYQPPGKVKNSPCSTQICPRNWFRLWMSENCYQNKNQYPRDLGLKFEKTNIEIRICILEILCVCVCACVRACVCGFQAKQKALTFSAQICPTMDIGLETQKTNVGIRINILEILYMPIFRQNEQLWLFRPNFAQKWI